MGPRRAPISIAVRAFARRMRVDEAAVRKAMRTGRLEKSLGRGPRGRLVIADAALAAQEWRANRDEAKVRPLGPGRAAAVRTSPKGPTIADERRLLIQEQRRAAKLANDRREGAVLPRQETELLWARRIAGAKTYLLGLPSRAKQRLPHLATSDLAVLGDIVRESLEALADGRVGREEEAGRAGAAR